MAIDQTPHAGFLDGLSVTPGICFVCRTESCGPLTLHLGIANMDTPLEGIIVVGERCVGEMAHIVGFPPLTTVEKLRHESMRLATEVAELRSELADAKDQAAQATGLLAAKFGTAAAS